MRASEPSACVTTSTSAPGIASHSAASMLANVIFIVTKLLTEILASSAFSRLMRRAGGVVGHHLRVVGLERLAGACVDLADQREVGVQEIADDAAERDELGAVAQPEVGAGLACPRPARGSAAAPAASCPAAPCWSARRRDSRLVAQRAADALEGACRGVERERAAGVARRRHDHERDRRVAHGLARRRAWRGCGRGWRRASRRGRFPAPARGRRRRRRPRRG